VALVLTAADSGDLKTQHAEIPDTDLGKGRGASLASAAAEPGREARSLASSAVCQKFLGMEPGAAALPLQGPGSVVAATIGEERHRWLAFVGKPAVPPASLLAAARWALAGSPLRVEQGS